MSIQLDGTSIASGSVSLNVQCWECTRRIAFYLCALFYVPPEVSGWLLLEEVCWTIYFKKYLYAPHPLKKLFTADNRQHRTIKEDNDLENGHIKITQQQENSCIVKTSERSIMRLREPF